MVRSYLTYLKNRQNAHGLHSPFLFEFYNEVLKKAKHTKFRQIESLRGRINKSKASIEIVDFGAGSKRFSGSNRQVGQLVKTAGIRPKYGKLLNRIIAFYGLKSGLELGTSLGFGAAYLCDGNPNFNLITLEGCPKTADLARNHLNQLGYHNYWIMNGEFSALLKTEPVSELTYDLIYIDGNHQFQPTLDYFDFALNHVEDHSFIIFDDIHWSDEMEKAWKHIAADPRINVSIDLFQLGIVCIRKGQRKQHFVVKY